MSKLNPMRLGTPRAYQNIPQVGEVSQDLDVCTGNCNAIAVELGGERTT